MNTRELLEQLENTERRIATANVKALLMRMNELHCNKAGYTGWMLEDQADYELVAYTQKIMQHSLARARRAGRQGWWNRDKCDTSTLRTLLFRAIDDNDMISVINYAAMMQVRKVTDAQ